jgi:hypothetical protein
MMCLGCRAAVAEFWWWCPECGGTIEGEHERIDRRGGYSEYSVEWAVPISSLVKHGRGRGSEAPGPADDEGAGQGAPRVWPGDWRRRREAGCN